MSELTCKQIFAEIPKRFKPEGAGSWKATIQFDISGPRGGNFYLTVAEGTCTSSEGTADAPTATVTTTDETWIGITVTRSVNAQMAFMKGQLKVKGNIGDVIKLQSPSVFDPS